jgi:hypothetical protein
MNWKLGAALTAALIGVGTVPAWDEPKPNASTSDAAPNTASSVVAPTMRDDQPRDMSGLHNVVAYHDGYYSGSVPEGTEGFDTLATMGVRTIISVDGAVPDVEKARARGMRYIHLPIGYNGFDDTRKLELARATRDAMKNGAVYVHCHHGKHRSAGAAGTAAASIGWSSAEDMVKRMKVSGTSPGYKGLYGCTLTATALPADVIDAVPANFPEISRPVGFVRGMVETDEVFDHLKLIEKAGWSVPPSHPDLVPAAEAERMVELFRAMIVDDRVKREPAEFAAMMNQTRTHAQSLVVLLRANDRDLGKLSGAFTQLTATCTDCHARFRD